MNYKDKNIDFKIWWNFVENEFASSDSIIHGLGHIRNVEKDGIFLSEHLGADIICVRLFALFHDIKRENDGQDPEHGKRAADYVVKLNGDLFDLDDDRLEKLVYACSFHTDGQISDDITIGTCWDADRLDIGRIGIEPSEKYMSTKIGKDECRKRR